MSTTDLDEQIRQLGEESRSFGRNLKGKINKLEARMRHNNIVRKQ